jgi:hypothetical protein
VAYYVDKYGSVEPEVVDLYMEYGFHHRLSDLRSVRKRRKLPASTLPESAIHHDVITAFGPLANAERAIKALQRAIHLIEVKGLITGYGRPNKNYFAHSRLRKEIEET